MYVNVVGVCWQQKHSDVCEDGSINFLLVSNGAVITGGRVVNRTLRIITDRQKENVPWTLLKQEDRSPLSQYRLKQTHH